MPKKSQTLLGITSVILVASNIYLYTEFQSFTANIDQAKPLSETSIVSPSEKELGQTSSERYNRHHHSFGSVVETL